MPIGIDGKVDAGKFYFPIAENDGNPKTSGIRAILTETHKGNCSQFFRSINVWVKTHIFRWQAVEVKEKSIGPDNIVHETTHSCILKTSQVAKQLHVKSSEVRNAIHHETFHTLYEDHQVDVEKYLTESYMKGLKRKNPDLYTDINFFRTAYLEEVPLEDIGEQSSHFDTNLRSLSYEQLHEVIEWAKSFDHSRHTNDGTAVARQLELAVRKKDLEERYPYLIYNYNDKATQIWSGRSLGNNCLIFKRAASDDDFQEVEPPPKKKSRETSHIVPAKPLPPKPLLQPRIAVMPSVPIIIPNPSYATTQSPAPKEDDEDRSDELRRSSDDSTDTSDSSDTNLSRRNTEAADTKPEEFGANPQIPVEEHVTVTTQPTPTSLNNSNEDVNKDPIDDDLSSSSDTEYESFDKDEGENEAQIAQSANLSVSQTQSTTSDEYPVNANTLEAERQLLDNLEELKQAYPGLESMFQTYTSNIKGEEKDSFYATIDLLDINTINTLDRIKDVFSWASVVKNNASKHGPYPSEIKGKEAIQWIKLARLKRQIERDNRDWAVDYIEPSFPIFPESPGVWSGKPLGPEYLMVMKTPTGAVESLAGYKKE